MSRGDTDSSSGSDTEDTETRFVPGENDDEDLWSASEILEERGNMYKVRWKGADEKTNKPWPPSWTYKCDCNDALQATWKKKKEAMKKRKKSTAKGRQSKARSSAASAKNKKRSESTSTATTTRRSRRNAKDLIPSTSARSPSPERAPSPRASSSRAPPPHPGPLKELKPVRDSYEDNANSTSAEPARPRKRRKVEVEIVQSSPSRPAPPPESSHKTVSRKKLGKAAISRVDLDEEDEDTLRPARIGSSRPAGSSKGEDRALATVEEGAEETTDVPFSKVGPPRHLKRNRQSKSHDSALSRAHSGDAGGSGSPALGRPRQVPSNPHESMMSSSGRSAKVTPSGSSSHSRAQKPVGASTTLNGQAPKPAEVVGGPRRSKSHTLAQLDSESESDDEELLNPAFLKALQQAKSRSASSQISSATRRILAREEEESTQEAANWIPPPSPPVVQRSSSPPAEQPPARCASLRRDGNAEAGPSRPSGKNVLQGRPSANDTFSREGIVPETQPYAGPESPDVRTRSAPPRDALIMARDPPSTPRRPQSVQQPSPSHITSSVKAKMKRKRTSTKELRPVPTLSPSVFRPHLPSADDDDIEQFSSPEKGSRRKALTLDVPTQDTIEEPEFTQPPMDSFMDWEGGAQPDEDLFAAEDNGPALSLGPNLPPPDEEGGPRQAMTTVLSRRSGSRQERSAEVTASPEVPMFQELPSTSSTQRAEADSQSQLSLSNQITELNAVLEEKDEQLSQLEVQMEELQSRIAELEAEQTEGTTSHAAELKALQEASDDKTEQISQLESQLVELQLQLTQQVSDADNDRERHELQIRELTESLEERTEQVSQLENALVELQTEIAGTLTENERLATAGQQSAAEVSKHAEKLAAAQQRVTTLEQELSDVRARLLQAEEESAALTSRLDTSTQHWERRFKYAEDDRDMFKNLYSEASTHASRLAKENAALEERATVAEGQVRDGLAMIRGTFEGQVRMLRAEAEKWQALCGVLTAKDARTDDGVRRRAALEPRLREENARLKEEAEIVRADMEKMAAIITQMTEQGERSEEDAGADADVDEDGEAHGEDSSPWHGKAFRDLNGVRSASPRVSPRASLNAEESEEEVVFHCQHVCDGVICHETFAAPEDVVEHARKTHYSDVMFIEA